MDTDRHAGHLTADDIHRNANFRVKNWKALGLNLTHRGFRKRGPGIVLCSQYPSDLELWIVSVANIFDDTHDARQACDRKKSHIHGHDDFSPWLKPGVSW